MKNKNKNYKYNCRGKKIQEKKLKRKGIILIALATFLAIGTAYISLWYENVLYYTSWAIAEVNAKEVRTPLNVDTAVDSVEKEIRDIASEHDFQWTEYLVKLAICESNLNQFAINSKGNSPAWSTDRGVFQINDYWQSKVSNECSFNIRCATEFTIDKINKGQQSLWVCDKLIK